MYQGVATVYQVCNPYSEVWHHQTHDLKHHYPQKWKASNFRDGQGEMPLSKGRCSSRRSNHGCKTGQGKPKPVKLPKTLRVMAPRPSPHKKPRAKILNTTRV